MSMLIRKRQLAAKIEAVEGSAETLLAADAGILVNFSPKASYDPQMYQRDPVRASIESGKALNTILRAIGRAR